MATAPTDQPLEMDLPCASKVHQPDTAAGASSHIPSSTAESSKKPDTAISRRSTLTLLKKLAVVWGLFMCCWLPLALTHSADYTGLIDPRVLHVAFALAQCNSAMNVITYGALSKDIRAAYRRTLRCKRV